MATSCWVVMYGCCLLLAVLHMAWLPSLYIGGSNMTEGAMDVSSQVGALKLHLHLLQMLIALVRQSHMETPYLQVAAPTVVPHVMIATVACDIALLQASQAWLSLSTL